MEFNKAVEPKNDRDIETVVKLNLRIFNSIFKEGAP